MAWLRHNCSSLGKLVTQEGDTLEGLIAFQGKDKFAFKADKNSGRSFFDRDELMGFEIDDERYQQHIVEVIRGNFPEKVKTFLLVVEEGPVTLLEYKGPGIFGSKEHVNYYVHMGEQPRRVNRNPGNFKKTMRHYFGDCEELAARIKSKELGYDNLKEIVTQYNEWHAKQPVPADNPDPEVEESEE